MLVDNKPVEVLAFLPAQAEEVRKEDSSNKSVQYVALGILSAAVLVGIYYSINDLNFQLINNQSESSPLDLNDKLDECIAKCRRQRDASDDLVDEKMDEFYKALDYARVTIEEPLYEKLYEKVDGVRDWAISQEYIISAQHKKCRADCYEDYNREESVKI
jgi:hypothetical protein